MGLRFRLPRQILSQHPYLLLATAISYAVGAALRVYVLVQDPPYYNLHVDAVAYTSVGRAMAGARAPSGDDVIWPPGMAGFLGSIFWVDPTLHLAAFLQTGISCLLPLLIAAIAFRWFGLKAACLAAMATSLDLALIHQTRIFYSDSLFTSTLLLALLPLNFLPARSARTRTKIALAVGLSLGICFVIRTTTLPIAATVLLGLALVGPNRKWLRDDWKALGVGVLSFSPLFAAASIRCTSLNVGGRFCPCSINTLLNVVLGHSGMERAVEFQRDEFFDWSSWTPALADRTGVRKVACSIGNTGCLLRQVFGDWVHDPWQMLKDSLRNVALLFDTSLSGDMNALFGREVRYVLETGFVLLVLAPCLWRLVPVLRDGLMPLVVRAAALCLVGLFGVSALAMGLPRYRVAFDPMFILLAVSSGAVRSAEDGTAAEERLLGVLIAFTGAVTLLLTFLFVPIFEPARVQVYRLMLPLMAPRPRQVIDVAASDLSRVPAENEPQDAPGNQVLDCHDGCPELRVHFPGVMRRKSIALACSGSVYLVRTYRDGKVTAAATFGEHQQGTIHWYDVPLSTDAEADFDTVGVMPLFGDKTPSVAYVRP
jgi:hypothetical protein